MTKFKITVEIEVDDDWLRKYPSHEANAVGNYVLRLLETEHLTPDWRIKIELLN